MTDRQSEQERESDAAFVERMGSAYGFFVAESCGLKEVGIEWDRLISFARRAAAIPDAGAEDVERVARAIHFASDGLDLDSAFSSANDGHWAHWWAEDRDHHVCVARAALAAMPRRDERAGMLRAAVAAYAIYDDTNFIPGKGLIIDVCLTKDEADGALEHWHGSGATMRIEPLYAAPLPQPDPQSEVWRAKVGSAYAILRVHDAEHAAQQFLREALASTPTPTPEQPRDDGWQPIAGARLDGTKMHIWHRFWGCGPQIGYYDTATSWWRIGDEKHWIGVGIFPSHFHDFPVPPAPVTK